MADPDSGFELETSFLCEERNAEYTDENFSGKYGSEFETVVAIKECMEEAEEKVFVSSKKSEISDGEHSESDIFNQILGQVLIMVFEDEKGGGTKEKQKKEDEGDTGLIKFMKWFEGEHVLGIVDVKICEELHVAFEEHYEVEWPEGEWSQE